LPYQAPGRNVRKLGREKSIIQVETITLDVFCEVTDLYPNVVEIDVEGAELVLYGCKEPLKERRTAFIVAVHPLGCLKAKGLGTL
jgi:FkbM family methyltransferase